VAGLSAGYYLRKNNLPFTVYEKGSRIGGNCATFRFGDFYLDSGAHRFHDKDEVSTEVMKDLLGDDLQETHTPSQIYYKGQMIDFPLAPLGLAKHLGLRGTARACYQLVKSRWKNGDRFVKDLKRFATHTYGKTIAERFLLNYSEKLWGTTCDRLSADMARTRLKGLGLHAFVKEAVNGGRRAGNLEGSFYYPRQGIGTIAQRLGESCGWENIRTKSEVTRINHDGGRIQSIVINGSETVDVTEVISTLPLTRLLSVMEPPPETGVLTSAEKLRFRGLVLVALFLKKPSVNPNATVYFPDGDVAFTRAYEPRNRSLHMSPQGRTSLVLEVPCDPGDSYWTMEDHEIMRLVISQLEDIGWIQWRDLLDFAVWRIEHAYPVVEVTTGDTLVRIHKVLGDFHNLRIAGRNGRFVYASIHDLLRSSREIAEKYAA
jgi:protoporphyrinogen oxidase